MTSFKTKAMIAAALAALAVSAFAVDGQTDVLPDGKTTFIIDKPGSYILVDNVTMTADAVCILIKAHNVTLDMHGHTIKGAAGNVKTGILADFIPGQQVERFDKSVVKNGSVENFGNGGVILGNGSRVSKITASGNQKLGISVTYGSVVEDCVANANTELGIATAAHCQIRRCNVYDNNDTQSENCIGIRTESNCVIENNICRKNQSTDASGIGIYASAYCLIRGNNCSYNNGKQGGDGIYATLSVIDKNVCCQNQTGITADASTITNNNVTSNQLGIVVFGKCWVQNNVCSSNVGTADNVNGIGVNVRGQANSIVENTANWNFGYQTGYGCGILVEDKYNEIRNNHCTGNPGYGIRINSGADSDIAVIQNVTSANSVKGIQFDSGVTGCVAAGNLTSDGINLNGNKAGSTPGGANDTF